MANTSTIRLIGETARSVKEISEIEQVGKSLVVRRLLLNSIKEWKIQHAIEGYQTGMFSTEQAATKSGIGLWEFIHLLKKRKIPVTYDLNEIKKDIKSISQIR